MVATPTVRTVTTRTQCLMACSGMRPTSTPDRSTRCDQELLMIPIVGIAIACQGGRMTFDSLRNLLLKNHLCGTVHPARCR